VTAVGGSRNDPILLGRRAAIPRPRAPISAAAGCATVAAGHIASHHSGSDPDEDTTANGMNPTRGRLLRPRRNEPPSRKAEPIR
jgi:hypothetical protein